MPITQQQLLRILPNAGAKAGVFVPILNTAMQRYHIVGTKRVVAFIAQIGHDRDEHSYGFVYGYDRYLRIPRPSGH